MKYLFDTDICVDLIRKKPASILRHLERLGLGEVGISAITYSELSFGAENSSRPDVNHQLLLEFVAPLEIKDYPADAALVYGRLRHALSKKGLPIRPLDLLIAAHAVYLDVILVTNNRAEFSRVPGLRVENWLRH